MLSEEKQNKIYQKVKAETIKEVARLIKEGKEEEAYDYEATEIFRYQDACFEESEKEKKAGPYVTL